MAGKRETALEEEKSDRGRGDYTCGSPVCKDTCADLIRSTAANYTSTSLPGCLPNRSEREEGRRAKGVHPPTDPSPEPEHM